MTCPQCLHCVELAKAATPKGNPAFVPMRDLFVAKWEAKYRDKYLFEPQDAVQLNAMIKRHDGIVSRWGAIVDRYLSEDFWGTKRHPLRVLATRPGEFTGPVRTDARCAFHKAPGTTNRKAPGGMAKDCPECKHVAAGRAERESEPTQVGNLLDRIKPPPGPAPTLEELRAARVARGVR